MIKPEIHFCNTCLMPSTRPRITFDSNGICNGCQTYQNRLQTDYARRKHELQVLLKTARANKRGNYDVVLAWSGGKDSSAIAFRLRDEFFVRPLLVTFAQLVLSEEGRRNRDAVIASGFDAVLIEPNMAVSRRLSRHFFEERGDPKLHWNAGVHSAPVRVAIEVGAPIVFFAENGEAEYGGAVRNLEALRTRTRTDLIEHAVGEDPEGWTRLGFSSQDLFPYVYPRAENASSTATHYFAYYVPWDGASNLNLVESHVGFTRRIRGRNVGAVGNVNGVDDALEDLYYYMQFIKFGFGRAHKDVARLVQRQELSRKEAIELINEFDGEEPTDLMDTFVEFFGYDDEQQLRAVIDSHRHPAIWNTNKDGGWVRKFKLPAA